MILSLVILVLLSFIQVSLLPFNLVFLVLIASSFAKSNPSSLWLGFGFGLLVAFLSGTPLGLLSLIYVLAIESIGIIKKTPFVSQKLFIVPVAFLLIMFEQIILKFSLGSTLDLRSGLIQTILCTIIYFSIEFFSSGFTPRLGLKLRT